MMIRSAMRETTRSGALVLYELYPEAVHLTP